MARCALQGRAQAWRFGRRVRAGPMRDRRPRLKRSSLPVSLASPLLRSRRRTLLQGPCPRTRWGDCNAFAAGDGCGAWHRFRPLQPQGLNLSRAGKSSPGSPAKLNSYLHGAVQHGVSGCRAEGEPAFAELPTPALVLLPGLPRSRPGPEPTVKIKTRVRAVESQAPSGSRSPLPTAALRLPILKSRCR